MYKVIHIQFTLTQVIVKTKSGTWEYFPSTLYYVKLHLGGRTPFPDCAKYWGISLVVLMVYS